MTVTAETNLKNSVAAKPATLPTLPTLATSHGVKAVAKKAKPVANVPARTAANTAVKATAKSVAKPAAKPVAKSSNKPAVKATVQPKAAKPVKAKKPKLVRDSFTIPKAEYTVLDDLKQRSARLASPAKKSELLRAGIKALAAMPDAAFMAALGAVPAIKTGRPSKA